MATLPHTSERTARVPQLMKEGADAFNARDVEAMNAAHHPDMIAHVTGSPEPIIGLEAHAAVSRALTKRRDRGSPGVRHRGSRARSTLALQPPVARPAFPGRPCLRKPRLR